MWDHRENGVMGACITMIRVKRVIQWGRSKIRGAKGGWDHREIFFLKNDSYDCDKNEKRKEMR